jgi:hypothetical protein
MGMGISTSVDFSRVETTDKQSTSYQPSSSQPSTTGSQALFFFIHPSSSFIHPSITIHHYQVVDDIAPNPSALHLAVCL